MVTWEHAAAGSLPRLPVLTADSRLSYGGVMPPHNRAGWVGQAGLGLGARTLRSEIAESLLNAILAGKLRPGDRLNESALSREMKVSRAPIREALQQLQEQGVVVNQPRKGMFVVSLDDEDLQKINSLRLILEAEALRLSRERATPAGLAKMRKLLQKMERSHSTPMEGLRLDLEFHRTLWSLSGNEYLEHTLTSLTAPLFAYAILARPKAEKMRMILDSHQPLYEYAAGRSGRRAEDVIYEHLALRWHEPDRFTSHRLARESAR